MTRGFPETAPSLLTVILDTNPASWDLLENTISLDKAVSDILVFLNAHLASNYTNKVALLASHCGSAQWLFPSPRSSQQQRRSAGTETTNGVRRNVADPDVVEPTKRLRINPPQDRALNEPQQRPRTKEANGNTDPGLKADHNSSKYRPFRSVEEEVVTNLKTLVQTTKPSDVSNSTSTMIAGALTLALSYINREMLSYAEARGGPRAAAAESLQTSVARSGMAERNALQARILLLSVSPSSDLAKQYIPIMNTIFACQRLTIPIDICQISLPGSTSNSTVFLQQACDATKGIYIPITAPSALLQYLLMAFLPSPSSRAQLVLPTRIDVDFRAACFCHRRVVDIGFVCSICLSIFCSVPEGGDCLVCGTHLTLSKELGGKPVVVVKKRKAGAGGKKRKNRALATALGGDSQSAASTPTPGPS